MQGLRMQGFYANACTHTIHTELMPFVRKSNLSQAVLWHFIVSELGIYENSGQLCPFSLSPKWATRWKLQGSSLHLTYRQSQQKERNLSFGSFLFYHWIGSLYCIIEKSCVSKGLHKASGTSSALSYTLLLLCLFLEQIFLLLWKMLMGCY